MKNTQSMNCDRYSSINSLVHMLPPENLVEKCATVDECGRDCGWRPSVVYCKKFDKRIGTFKKRLPLFLLNNKCSKLAVIITANENQISLDLGFAPFGMAPSICAAARCFRESKPCKPIIPRRAFCAIPGIKSHTF